MWIEIWSWSDGGRFSTKAARPHVDVCISYNKTLFISLLRTFGSLYYSFNLFKNTIFSLNSAFSVSSDEIIDARELLIIEKKKMPAIINTTQ